MTALEIHPIGTFHSLEKYPYDAPHQPERTGEVNCGRIALLPGYNFEQALDDLASFSHLWIVFQFHKNEGWRPKVLPPRGTRKVGLFATRSPYRPNPIGLTCVRLDHIENLTLFVSSHDLLDGTPILDIKPYLAYTDAIPDATRGWLDELPPPYTLIFTDAFEAAYARMLACGGPFALRGFLREHLAHNPTLDVRKRVAQNPEGSYTLAYRTWRVYFYLDETQHRIEIFSLASGYTPEELRSPEDPYADKSIHRRFTTS